MGAQKQYLDSGGFSKYLYHQKGEIIHVGNLIGKIIEHIDGCHKGLPLYSNTSTVYFKENSEGNIIQCRIYSSRGSFLDFDWGHKHINAKDGRVFEKGIVHVQPYIIKNGIPWRDSKNARSMSTAEMKQYGEILRKLNPKLKLR